MFDPPTTLVGLMHVVLRIPLCNSLKEKRSAVRPCVEYLRRSLNLAVAETGEQDEWRRAVLSMVTVSGDKTMVEAALREAEKYLARRHNLEVLDVQIEIL